MKGIDSLSAIRHQGELPERSMKSADIIAQRLRDAIFTGTYANGERLPAERDLAEHFGASRGTVREALKRLEDQQLLVRKIGSGTFVHHSGDESAIDIADKTSPLELIEVRISLEPAICRLAAVNATRRDLFDLEETMRKLEAAEDREAFSQADEAFHMALAECTHNPLLVWLYRQTNEVRAHDQWGLMKRKILSRDNITAYNAQHRQILEALRSRDVDQAVSSIKLHLEKARQDLLGAPEGTELGGLET